MRPGRSARLLGGWLSQRMRLDSGQRRIILACGAGAGLAAVYDVPLGGALFTLEVLLVSAAAREVIPAILSSAIAAAIAWPVLGHQPTYAVPPLSADATVLVFAVLLGPVAAVIGVGFPPVDHLDPPLAPKAGWRLPVFMTVDLRCGRCGGDRFSRVARQRQGAGATRFRRHPQPASLGALLLLKPLATAACLGSGARGGLLTPAVATGALLGALTGDLWVLMWPGAPTAAFALIGAAAVLATTQRAPLCAIVLIMEFTQTGLDLLIPMLIAVAGALLTARLLPTNGWRTRSRARRDGLRQLPNAVTAVLQTSAHSREQPLRAHTLGGYCSVRRGAYPSPVRVVGRPGCDEG